MNVASVRYASARWVEVSLHRLVPRTPLHDAHFRGVLVHTLRRMPSNLLHTLKSIRAGAAMAYWQSLCRACATGIHEGGCCGCMACRVVPEPVAPLTRQEVEEAIQHLRATMKRAPKTMAERYHKQLDDLLDQRDAAVLEETYKLPDA